MKKTNLLALVLACVMLFAACSPAADNGSTTTQGSTTTGTTQGATTTEGTTAPAGPKILRLYETSDATTLNAHQALASLEDGMLKYVMGCLYKEIPMLDGVGSEIVPELADGNPIMADSEGKVWHIKISPDAKWENGDPITADTFMYSWKMQLDPVLLNPTANTFYQYYIEIENAANYFMQNEDGKAKVDWEDVGVKKVDDMTVEIRTTQRYNEIAVMRHLTSKSSMPVYEPWYEQYMNDSRSATTYGTEKDKLMCCGVFKLESWVKGSELVYAKNELSTLADRVKLDKVQVRIIQDSGTALQMFEAGEIDYISLSGDAIDKYAEDPRTKSYPYRTVMFLDMNKGHTENPILGNLNFRKAFYYALDRETLASLVKQRPTAVYMHHTAGAYPEENILYRDLPEAKAMEPANYGYDPDLAVQYFEAALADMGITDKVTIDIMYSDSSASTKVLSEYIQKAVPEIFGTDRFAITLTSAPSSSFSQTKRSWRTNPNSFQLGWGGWSNTSTLYFPNTQFKYFVSSYSSGFAPYENDEFDALFALSETEEYRLNQDKLVEATLQLEKIWLDEVFAIPVYETVYYTMFNPRVITAVKNNEATVGWAHMFSDIDLSK